MKTFALTRSQIIKLVLGLCLVFAIACVAFLSGTWEPAHAEPGSAGTYSPTSNTKASPSPSSKSSTPTSNTKASPSPSSKASSPSPSSSSGGSSSSQPPSSKSNTSKTSSPSSKASSPPPSSSSGGSSSSQPPSSKSNTSKTPSPSSKASSPPPGSSPSGSPPSSGGGSSGGLISGATQSQGYVTYNAGVFGELIIYSSAGKQIISTFTVSNIRTAAGGGKVGTLSDNTIVGYSPTLSAQNGYDTWVANVPPTSSSSSGSSGSGKSGGSGSGGTGGSGSSGGSSQPAGSTGGTPWGGYWEQQQSCTSSGKGGRSCSSTWVWIADSVSQTSSPCETATCSGQGEPLSGGSGEGAASQLPIWIDAVPRLVRTGSSSALEWGSTDAESCIIKLSGNAVFTGTSGQGPVDDITEQRTYVLQCDMEAGNILTSSVTISIIPVWREF